jgi:hypothetical protein
MKTIPRQDHAELGVVQREKKIGLIQLPAIHPSAQELGICHHISIASQRTALREIPPSE